MCDIFAAGSALAQPFHGGGLMLDVRICRVDRKQTFSARYTVRSSFVLVVEVDTQDLCKAMTDFG